MGASQAFGGTPAMPGGPNQGAVRLPGGGMDTSALFQKMQAQYPTTNPNDIMQQIQQQTLRNNNARQTGLNQQNPLPQQGNVVGSDEIVPKFHQGPYIAPDPFGRPLNRGFMNPALPPQQGPMRAGALF